MLPKRSITLLTAAVAVVAVASATLIALLRSGGSEDLPLPEGLTAASPTPDVGGVASPEEGAALLSQNPASARLLGDLQRGDAQSIVNRIKWAMQPCPAPGEGRGAVEPCPPGTPAGTPLPMIDVGPGEFEFWITEPTLRQNLDVAVQGGLALGYGGRINATGELVLGMDGPAKGRGVPPVTSPDVALTGVMVVFSETSGEILEVWFISEPSSARQFGLAIAEVMPQQIITIRTQSVTN